LRADNSLDGIDEIVIDMTIAAINGYLGCEDYRGVVYGK
jgi:hypothetical protein